jgi:hypothetical protein
MKLQAAAALKNGYVGGGAARRTRGVEYRRRAAVFSCSKNTLYKKNIFRHIKLVIHV